MKKIIPGLYVLISIAFCIYLVLPSRGFPDPLPGSVRSDEEGDNETSLRRAYFTNLQREEIINYYKKEFWYLPTLRLNYPPEDAQTLIRDQTRSTFLEELVHPFRESFYINGFKPIKAKDDIWYKGVHYVEKITVVYVPNSPIIRLLVIIPTQFFVWIVIAQFLKSIKEFRLKKI
ncbi:MAG: hypothetical protein HY044_03115 [Candidatus Woesebacteria bacterium]|nr:MAG: hypothetical protein HY044_03115 [Candidatus Woesebacteria bacterium]